MTLWGWTTAIFHFLTQSRGNTYITSCPVGGYNHKLILWNFKCFKSAKFGVRYCGIEKLRYCNLYEVSLDIVCIYLVKSTLPRLYENKR